MEKTLSTMAETRFNNREIKLMFQEQNGKIADIHTDVKEVLEQTKKTNGRVGRLEQWKGFITGGLAVITVLIVPILIYLVTHWNK